MFSTRTGNLGTKVGKKTTLWTPGQWMSLTSGTTWLSVSDLSWRLKHAGATNKTLGTMESLASLRPSWCFEHSDHVTLSHHDTSCHICTEFASEIGSHQTSHSQQLKPRQLGPKYVQSMSRGIRFPWSLGSPADWTAEEVQTNASSEPGVDTPVLLYGGFHTWGYPSSWMVYDEKTLWNWWFGGTPIYGKPPYACYALLCYVLPKAQCHHTESESSVLLPCLNEHTSKFIKALEQTLKGYRKSGTCLKAFVTMEYHGSRTNPGYTVLFEQGTPWSNQTLSHSVTLSCVWAKDCSKGATMEVK